MSSVDVSHVSKSFGPVKVLDNITVNFPDGGFFALLGPSGSGKTTLLRMIAGFHFPDAGTIRIGDENVGNVPVEKRDVGMMFQNYALFPNLTVAENVGFGLRVRKIPAAEERRRIAEVLELVQLTEMAQRKPAQLSGGQQQRVALARAIVTNPRVLLLDEPLSALDKTLRIDMQFELKRIQREIGITTIFVTHDQEEALTLSDNIGILRSGRIIQSGPPREVYDNPVDAFCAGFLGEANWIPETRLDGLTLPADIASNEFAVRPEMLSISPTKPAVGNAIRGKVVHRIFAGSMATSLIDVDGRQWKVIARDRDMPVLDDEGRVWLSWDPSDTISVPAKLAS
ncbi:MAG: ABC transporter ATP-binding protein [Paracoccus denitrificans]|uniref:ABC transporter ATP-binding protein n=1 Tax=Paracoccus denitrificans TaxID=266 RepID=A0A533I302_PARDE|nr:MAG: ABC transporter ATP-binding protein [Paracoccus denitrificans]